MVFSFLWLRGSGNVSIDPLDATESQSVDDVSMRVAMHFWWEPFVIESAINNRFSQFKLQKHTCSDVIAFEVKAKTSRSQDPVKNLLIECDGRDKKQQISIKRVLIGDETSCHPHMNVNMSAYDLQQGYPACGLTNNVLLLITL